MDLNKTKTFPANVSKALTGLLLTAFLIPVSVADSVAPDPNPTECDLPHESSIITSESLSILTLNLAHGRKDALNQMLQRTHTTRSNLEEIATFLTNSGADLVALQEADSPSRWSGKFNHVDFVSAKSPYPCRLHAHHAQKYMYDFGTALISRVPFSNSLLHTFEPSPPTTNKGFVMGQVNWNPGGLLSEPVTVSIISVHLDFSRKKVREAQIEEMRAMMPDIETPLIILGDFNTDWSTDNSALRSIVSNGNLKVYQPDSTELGTYKDGKHRLDWIVISKDLEFVHYEVPEIILSDHQPVLASVRLIEKPLQELESNNHD